MNRQYRGLWLLIGSLAGGSALWMFEGAAYMRRGSLPPAPPESARKADHFVALAFPRISDDGSLYALTPEHFDAVLDGLKRLGYASIGFGDVLDLRRRGRRLPERAVLIALERDDPRSVRFADAALRKHGMRAAVFLDRSPRRAPRGERRALSAHAVRQLVKGGAWDLGWFSDGATAVPGSEPWSRAVFDDGTRPWTRHASRAPLRFAASRSGHNGPGRPSGELRMLRVDPQRASHETLRRIHSEWPRDSEFVDLFPGGRLGPEWIVDWGVVAGGRGRMAILPRPQQTGAAVSLTGTEDWSDVDLELDVLRYRRSAWAYLRSHEDGRYLRAGVMDGAWKVQEKADPDSRPVTLASAPVPPGGLPARMRLVLKGPWALVQVGDRMVFGKAVKVDPRVARGPLQLNVYDRRPKEARAVLSRLRAAPLKREWAAVSARALEGEPSPALLEGLRRRALTARALSPEWLRLRPDGRVEAEPAHRELLGSVAGHYRCALVPFLDAASVAPPADPAGVSRLIEGLVREAAALGADGVNLRLDPARRRGLDDAALSRLRRLLGEQGRGLWVTLASAEDRAEGLGGAARLRPLSRRAPGLTTLVEEGL